MLLSDALDDSNPLDQRINFPSNSKPQIFSPVIWISTPLRVATTFRSVMSSNLEQNRFSFCFFPGNSRYLWNEKTSHHKSTKQENVVLCFLFILIGPVAHIQLSHFLPPISACGIINPVSGDKTIVLIVHSSLNWFSANPSKHFIYDGFYLWIGIRFECFLKVTSHIANGRRAREFVFRVATKHFFWIGHYWQPHECSQLLRTHLSLVFQLFKIAIYALSLGRRLPSLAVCIRIFWKTHPPESKGRSSELVALSPAPNCST